LPTYIIPSIKFFKASLNIVKEESVMSTINGFPKLDKGQKPTFCLLPIVKT